MRTFSSGRASAFATACLRDARDLRADPDVTAVGRHMHRAVHGLHGGVRQKRVFVGAVELGRSFGHCRVGIALFFGDRAFPFRRALASAATTSAVESVAVRAVVELRLGCLEPLARRPVIVGDDRDGVVDLRDLAYARHRERRGLIDRGSLPPNTGEAATVAIFMPGTLTSMP